MTNSDKREQWAAHRDTTLTRWRRKRPGHRPAIWWELEAPEARRRLGGVGSTWYSCMAACKTPMLEKGLPVLWISKFNEAYYNGVAVDIHGNRIESNHPDGAPRRPGDFKGIAVDVENPPTFESEPAYLQRLGLLTTDEAERLTPADFEPIPLPAQYWPQS